MVNDKDSPIRSTGTVDFSAGVDSRKVPTVQSLQNPNGLAKNQLAFASNLTMRDGALSPRDGWTKKGNISQALGPTFTPGTPAQSIPQPPVTEQVQTASAQGFFTNANWVIPAVGQNVTITTTNAPVPADVSEYVGNVFDVQEITNIGNVGPSGDIGKFSIIAFTSNNTTLNTITLQTVSSAWVGQTVGGTVPGDSGLIMNLVSLGPGTQVPQPPIIIPAGPDTYNPPVISWQGEVSPLYSPTGPDSFSPNGTPYGICVIGGQITAYDPDFVNPPLNLSAIWDEYFQPAQNGPQWPKCYFCQALQFLVIQAGDYNAQTGAGQLPIFWDGFKLTRSNGLTGITAVGEPIPNTFTLNVVGSVANTNLTASWTPPPVGDTVTLTLTAPYGTPAQATSNALTTLTGTSISNTQTSTAVQAAQALQHLGDNLTIYNSAPMELGVFRVVGISGVNITLETISLVGNPPTQTPGAFACTLTLPPVTTALCQVANGIWAVPKVGKKGSLNLTSIYFGSVGDTIQVQSLDATINYGTFTVLSFNSTNQLRLQTIASNFAGQQVGETSFIITVIAVRAFAFVQVLNSATPWTIQPAGGSSFMYWPKDSTAYTGSLFDIVKVVDKATNVLLGIFRVIGFIGPGVIQFLEQVLLETLSSNFVGQTFGVNPTVMALTVTEPPLNPQIVSLNAGQWVMPSIGGTVNLQLVWDIDQSAPYNFSYPGSVGDVVTLTGASPSTIEDIGQFQVTAFDGLGNISLQAVTPTNNFVNLTPGTILQGVTTVDINIIQPPSTGGTAISQLPAAGPMVYYQGIIWYAQGNVVSGGDIVGGPSGTSYYNFEDSVLAVTENPLAFGGDGFKLPIPGNITGMAWPAQIDASLGQGLLIIGTVNGLCSLQVPSSRPAWIAANVNNPPQLNVVQFNNGWTNDWGIVSVNGDLYFQSLEPGIRSMIQATRYFQQWGNIMIASNEQRVLKCVNRSLLNWCSGIYFNNRLLETTLPMQTIYGVIHQGIIPLDFMPISTLEEQLPPNWEGVQEGLQVFQLTTGIFSGVQRAFAVTLSTTATGEIDLWENVQNSYFDMPTNEVQTPIQWMAEFAAFTLEREFDIKELVGGELWVDNIRGEIVFKLEYRPDSSTCWILWNEWKVCSAQNSAENARNPIVYPLTPYPPGFKQVMAMPKPQLLAQPQTGRPSNVGYQFQPRLTVTGSCRVRGLLLHMILRNKSIYNQLV